MSDFIEGEDRSIDDETLWKFGYSVQCIVARATA